MSKAKSIKVIFIGSYASGKTSIICTYQQQNSKFEVVSTIGALYQKILLYDDNDKKLYIDLWDTAGEERFRGIMPIFYRNMSICVIVIDLYQNGYLDDLNVWNDTIKKTNDCDIIVVGNKIDLLDKNEYANRKQKLLERARMLNIENVTFTSIYDLSTVNTVFNTVLTNLINNKYLYLVNQPDTYIQVTKEINNETAEQYYYKCCY